MLKNLNLWIGVTLKINGKVISEPKSKLTIKNDPYSTFKMKFNKNKWNIKSMSIVCFDGLAEEVKRNINKNDLIRITLSKNFEVTKETLFIKPINIEIRKKKILNNEDILELTGETSWE